MTLSRTTRATLAKLHLWGGLIVALPLLLLAVTGSLLLFKDALWVPGEHRAAGMASGQAVGDDPALLAFLQQDANWQWVDVADEGRALHTIGDADGRERLLPVSAASTLAVTPRMLAFEHTLLALHTRLALADGAGKPLIRIVGLAGLALVIIGLVLWWPLRRRWRGADLLPRSASRPALLRLHWTLGAIASLLLLPMLLSAALLAHNPQVRAALAPYAVAPQRDGLPTFDPGSHAAALAAARGVFVDGELTQVSRDGARVSFKFRLPGEAHPNGRSTIVADLAEGKLLSARDVRRGGFPEAYDDFLYPFHTAHLGGSVHALLWLIGALSLVGMAVVGVLAWCRGRTSA